MNQSGSHWIEGRWIEGEGPEFISTDPATGETNWQGRAASARETDAAISAGRAAFVTWADLSVEKRADFLLKLAEKYRENKAKLAEAICREVGKPKWEALLELDAMIAKVGISIEAYNDRCKETKKDLSGAMGIRRFRPHGVLAVLGPFNMPGHLPNGHLVPALLAGNTIVLKPSEQTPLVGQLMAEMFAEAEFPKGVVNLVQGGPRTATSLAENNDLNGVLFTGSTQGGLALSRAFAEKTGKMLALEMGGNNPLVVHEPGDLDAAAYLIVQSAYITSGQRCSCGRRLIICEGKQADALIERLTQWVGKIRIGFWTDHPEPFMGPVISSAAAENWISAQEQRVAQGAIPLVGMKRLDRCAALLSPGLLDVTEMRDRPDAEIFGPLLQVIRVKDFAGAIAEGNNTAYGLSAGLISERADLYEQFVKNVRAGVIHWNRPLTGASSQLPFGGIGQSGNHRPGAYLAADYAAYSVAILEAPKAILPQKLSPGFVS